MKDLSLLISLYSLVLAIYLPIFIEKIQKPELEVIDTPVTKTPWRLNNVPQDWFWVAQIRVRHNPLPSGWRGLWASSWLERRTAQHCKGTITFTSEDETKKTMPLRWAGSPEPTTPQAHIVLSNKPSLIFNYKVNEQKEVMPDTLHYVMINSVLQGWTTQMEDEVNIEPGDINDIDVVMQVEDDPNCYGWNNESYAYIENTNVPKNPKYKFVQGRYIVNLQLSYSDRTVNKQFILVNTGMVSDLRLKLRVIQNNTVN